MSGHSMRFTFERDRVKLTPICEAPAEAICRWTCYRDCDEYYNTRFDGTAWWHSVDDYDWSRHKMVPYDGCNIYDHLVESTEEFAEDRASFHIADVPITATWDSEFYSWNKTEEKL